MKRITKLLEPPIVFLIKGLAKVISIIEMSIRK